MYNSADLLWTSLMLLHELFFFFFSSRRRHTRSLCDWSSDVCSSDLPSDVPVHPDQLPAEGPQPLVDAIAKDEPPVKRADRRGLGGHELAVQVDDHGDRKSVV